MKFDSLFDDGEVGPDVLDLSKHLSSSPCIVCEEATKWFDASMEVPLCSEECFQVFYSELEGNMNEIDSMFEEKAVYNPELSEYEGL